MSQDLLEVGLTQEKPVRPRKTKQQIQEDSQEDNQVDTSIVVPQSHLGFNHDGKCLTCGLKKMSNLAGSIYCPINFPECPRNIKE